MKRIAKKIRAFHEVGYDLPNWEEYNYDPIWQCERLFDQFIGETEIGHVWSSCRSVYSKETKTGRRDIIQLAVCMHHQFI